MNSNPKKKKTDYERIMEKIEKIPNVGPALAEALWPVIAAVSISAMVTSQLEEEKKRRTNRKPAPGDVMAGDTREMIIPMISEERKKLLKSTNIKIKYSKKLKLD